MTATALPLTALRNMASTGTSACNPRAFCCNDHRFLMIAATVRAKRNLSPGSAQMKLTGATIVFLILLVTIAVLGHSVWHAEVLSVMNFLSVVFTGST